MNLDEIARDLGIEVYRVPLGPDVAGMITRERSHDGQSEFTILVNIIDPSNRQRFTLAHEIAHYILHRDLIERGLTDDRLYRSHLSGPYETQANRLAAEILMPTQLIRDTYQQEPSATALARMFQVSEQAMRIRLDGMNLDHSQGSLF